MKRDKASFRDDSGYVFEKEGEIYRKVEPSYYEHFKHFIDSGLSEFLIRKGMLIPFEIEQEAPDLILHVKKIPFISYSYEWSFSMFKDAAILTLEIEKLAQKFGMTLKDASSYNIQFLGGKALFIDITSFEKKYEQGIWKPYQQFCRHFYGPLALMAKVDLSLNKFLACNIDGLPLDLVSKMLPVRSYFNINKFLHIYLHSKYVKKYENSKRTYNSKPIGNSENLIQNLIWAINGLTNNPKKSEWIDYYINSVEDAYLIRKKEVVKGWVSNLRPETLWDLGANNGKFSIFIQEFCGNVISTDIDDASIENLYLNQKENKSTNIIPLVLNVVNPSSGLGWENEERGSFISRLKNCHAILALAIVHHLRITYAIPIEFLANFFSKLTKVLIIEFVSKEDEKVKFLLSNRKDIFGDYTLENFETVFKRYFKLKNKVLINDSTRVLYYFENEKVS